MSKRKGMAKELYVYASPSQYVNTHVGNTVTNFIVDLPTGVLLSDYCKVALMDFKFRGKIPNHIEHLFVTCDVVENLSVVGQDRLPVLRKITIDKTRMLSDDGGSISEDFINPYYMRINQYSNQTIRVKLVDEHLETLSLSSSCTLNILLHFKWL